MIVRKIIFLLTLIASPLLLVGISYVMAGDETLLLDVPGPVTLSDTAVSQAKRVEINWSALEDPKTKRLSIHLFDGEVITAVHDQSFPSSAVEGTVWVGYVLGNDNSSVTLSQVEDVLVGSIVLDGIEQYRIGFNGRWQELQAIDTDKVSYAEGPDILIPSVKAEQDLNKSALCEDGSQIDLLVAYTASARIGEGGTAAIQALLNQRVAEMNTANANSGLAFKYRLVHLLETDYAETGSLVTDINRLRNGTDGYLDDVTAAREQYLADMTSLIVRESTTGNACGIGYLMTGLSTNFAGNAFNVTALDYIGDPYCHPLTMSHEFGHNMGNHHDRAHAGGSTVFPYSFGYQSPDNSFRTIMAYDCATESCPRVNHWSNPDVNYVGKPTGIDYEANPSNSADNVRSMAQTAYYVANFRQNCPAPPTPTSTPTATQTAEPTETLPAPTSTATPTSSPAPPQLRIFLPSVIR